MVKLWLWASIWFRCPATDTTKPAIGTNLGGLRSAHDLVLAGGRILHPGLCSPHL
jgi:hypothetical protein